MLVPGTSATTYLRTDEYDAIVRIARRNDVSVSALLRTMIRRELRTGGVKPIGEKK